MNLVALLLFIACIWTAHASDADNATLVDDLTASLKGCIIESLHSSFAGTSELYFPFNRAQRKHPTRVKPYSPLDPLVRIENVVDSMDVAHILALQVCMRRLAPQYVEDRDFTDHKDEKYGQNSVTFVGSYMMDLMPDLVAHLKRVVAGATAAAQWAPHPGQLGIRCIEVLEYSISSGQLGLHVDSDSIYTVSVMLNDPEVDFEGADFSIRRRHLDDSLMTVNASKYEGFVFDSNAMHGVAALLAGLRRVLVIELWPRVDVKPGDLRPLPDGSELLIPQLISTAPEAIQTYDIAAVRRCIAGSLNLLFAVTSEPYFPFNRGPRERPIRVKPYSPLDPLVRIENVVDSMDVAHILALQVCMRRLAPQYVEDRDFTNDKDEKYGQNSVTFVGSYMMDLMPDLVAHLKRVVAEATAAAQWAPHPGQLGIRCIEVLEYSISSGQLGLHVDSGSIYTVSVMLNDPEVDFEGADFSIRRRHLDDSLMTVNASKYEGFVFDSNAMHGVAALLAGLRQVLVIELWPWTDMKPGDTRPSRDGDDDTSALLTPEIPYLPPVYLHNELANVGEQFESEL